MGKPEQTFLVVKKKEPRKETSFFQDTIILPEESELKIQSRAKRNHLLRIESNRRAYSKGYCLNHIANEHSLWDMRCWEKYKDREEILEMIQRIVRKTERMNCGHACLCVRVLKESHKATDEEILDAFMVNNKIQFKNRLVTCFKDPYKCPRFKDTESYSESRCDECQ